MSNSKTLSYQNDSSMDTTEPFPLVPATVIIFGRMNSSLSKTFDTI